MRLHIFIPFALGPTVHDDVGGEGGLVALDEPAGQEFFHCSPRRAEYLHWGKAEARRVEYLHRSLCGAEQNHLNRLCGCFFLKEKQLSSACAEALGPIEKSQRILHHRIPRRKAFLHFWHLVTSRVQRFTTTLAVRRQKSQRILRPR